MVQSLMILLSQWQAPGAVARVLGLSVPIIGWGLLALGVGTTVWAAVLEPSELEAWARQTPFGLGNDAKLGWYDSLGGLTGASLDSVRVGVQFMQLRTLGSAATVSVTALQFGAALAGTFGGVLNAYVSKKKAGDAFEKNLPAIGYLHRTATIASSGIAMIGTVQTVASGSQALALRGIGGQAVRTVATRAGAVAAAAVLGLSVPVIGWGLLAIGVGATVWAAVLEPSELEAWARQTPFGLGPDQVKFKNLNALLSGLQHALGQASEAGNEIPAPVNQKVPA